MADAVANFAIRLEDALSPNAAKAKASIDAVSSSLKEAKSKLAGYQSQLALAKDLGDIEGHRKYSALVKESQKSVFDLAQKAEMSAGSLSAGASQAGAMSAALGVVAVAAGVAVGALAGLVSVTESLTVKALEVVNANQKMAATFEALGMQGAGSGKKTLAMLDDLSARLPQSREQLAEWTKKIEAMGVTDLSQIRSELVATASAQAIMGDEGAAAYEKIQQRVRLAVEAHHGLKLAEKSLRALYQAGVSETEVAKRMGLTTEQLSAKLKSGTVDAQKFGDALSASVTAKGAKPLDVMMNSLDTLKKKGFEALSHLFDGIETKPLTDALRNLIALGDTPAGEGLKMGLTGAMNAVIRMIGKGITEAEIFFLTIEVKALQTYIALKPLIGAVSKIADAMGAIGAIPGKAEGALAGATGVNEGEAAKGGEFATKAIRASMGDPFVFLGDLFNSTIGDLANAKALEAAHAQGAAVGGAVEAGMRDGLGVHSPSLAAMRIGMEVSAGLGMGMEASPMPERAARTISANALGGIQGGAKGIGAANTNAGPVSNTFHINITAPEGVTDAQEISVTGLATVLERYQIGSGR